MVSEEASQDEQLVRTSHLWNVLKATIPCLKNDNEKPLTGARKKRQEKGPLEEIERQRQPSQTGRTVQIRSSHFE